MPIAGLMKKTRIFHIDLDRTLWPRFVPDAKTHFLAATERESRVAFHRKFGQRTGRWRNKDGVGRKRCRVGQSRSLVAGNLSRQSSGFVRVLIVHASPMPRQTQPGQSTQETEWMG